MLGKYLKNPDSQFLEAVHDLYYNRYIPEVPYPSVEAMKTALDDIAAPDVRARSARPEQFIDASLMQDLEKDGFIKQLWK